MNIYEHPTRAHLGSSKSNRLNRATGRFVNIVEREVIIPCSVWSHRGLCKFRLSFPVLTVDMLSFQRGQLNDIPTFRVQDYSWDDHGYSLVNRLYNDVGNLLDDKFKTAYNLTYYTMGTHRKVDTSRFRRAIWNYIQCMFGIRHDDYDYNEVNQLLERSLKTFIKSAVCYPERVTKRDYDRVMREFKHSEKVGSRILCSFFPPIFVYTERRVYVSRYA